MFKLKKYFNINYLSHFLVLLSVIFLLFSYFSQDKSWVLLNGLGGKCLDFENKDFIEGATAIGYECFDHKDTQSFIFKDNHIIFEDKCLDIIGAGKDGDKLAFRACKNKMSQQWQYNVENKTISSYLGKCIDLGGGSQFWQSHQVLILWSCSEADNQKWYLSKPISKKSVKSDNVIRTNQLEKVLASQNVVAGRTGKLEFINGYKYGLLLTRDTSSMVDISEESYLVPAGAVESDFFE